MSHIPVMLNEVISALTPRAGETHLDCTFGAGGYSTAILEKGAKVVAVDMDPSASKFASALSEKFSGNLTFINSNFADVTDHIDSDKRFSGIVLDLGVSSMQLDTAERGFSFMRDGVLDMRMGSSGVSARDFVNSAEETELARVIYEYGDETASRKIAKAIVSARTHAPINSTLELASIVRKAIGHRGGKIDPATKTFQAIRIWVNKELESLEQFLDKCASLLEIGGRLVVVTFHSLEDRIVKHYLTTNIAKKVARSKYSKEPEDKSAIYKLLNKKPITPTEQEIKQNPRARSAKLRSAVKIGGVL